MARDEVSDLRFRRHHYRRLQRRTLTFCWRQIKLSRRKNTIYTK